MAHTETLTQEVFIKVFIVLAFLTALTLIQPYLIPVELSQTVSIQLFLALIKTVIIGAYYMHLKYESSLFRYIVFIAVLTLCIFFIIIAFDAIFRNNTSDFFI